MISTTKKVDLSSIINDAALLGKVALKNKKFSGCKISKFKHPKKNPNGIGLFNNRALICYD